MAELLDPVAFERQLVSGDREGLTSTLTGIAEQAVSKRLASFPATLDPDDVAQEAVAMALRSLRNWQSGPGRSSALSFASQVIRRSVMGNLGRAIRWAAKNTQAKVNDAA